VNSEQDCAVFGGPDIPCVRLATHQDTNIPAATQFAHQKHPKSFDSDWLSFNWFSSFDKDDVPAIELPETQWTTKCYNTENGFKVDPERGFVSTTAGRDSFTLQLTAKPIESLGSVRVNFQVSGVSDSTVLFQKADGTDANGLLFDSSNWNVPVTIHLKHVKDGETYFNIVATGGGYDIPYVMSSKQNHPQTETRSSSFRVLTCAHGQAGYGC